MKSPIEDSATCGCVGDHNKYKVEIWDTPGDKIFEPIILESLYRRDVVIFVYDVNKKETFKRVDSYYNKVKELNQKDMIFVLVGNKSDNDQIDKIKRLDHPQREVSFGDGLKCAMKLGIAFYEVSAKNGINVSAVFESAVTQLICKRSK